MANASHYESISERWSANVNPEYVKRRTTSAETDRINQKRAEYEQFCEEAREPHGSLYRMITEMLRSGDAANNR